VIFLIPQNNPQAMILHEYNKTHREKFNQKLFERSNDDIINALKDVIRSCQRTSHAVIRVIQFEVIEDYDEVQKILRRSEDERLRKQSKKINVYNYIDLKDSDILLLKVDYYIKAKDGSDILTVYIAIPRIVDKYYFRISGNTYYAMYQIVDNSTYNNSMSSSKKQSVTLKTMFMPIRIYRETANLSLKFINKHIKAVAYPSIIFSKKLNTAKYIFAKFGFVNALNFLGVLDSVYVCKDTSTVTDMDKQIYYYFNTPSSDIVIRVPICIFDNDYYIQSIITTIIQSIHRDTKYNNLYDNQFWLASLGGDFKNFDQVKGSAVLDSLEYVYDIITYSKIRLPEEDKQTIYHILRWMCREFTQLRIKDNLNLSFKRIRIAEYIASLYVAKLSRGIYRISDLGDKVTLKNIKKAINILPLILLHQIAKCNLVNYKNNVSDLDSVFAIKYSYKGISGIGDGNGKSVPDIYRMIHPSHLGRVDLDTSSASDPGMSGILCPLSDIYDNGMMSEIDEPNDWQNDYNQMMDNYKKLMGLKEIIQMEKEVMKIENPVREEMITESINILNGLRCPIQEIQNDYGLPSVEVPLEDGFVICTEYGDIDEPYENSPLDY
jgi:hypothetical protein